MENERLAKVETNVEWLVKTLSRLEPKIDHLFENESKSQFRWGKMIGAVLVINAVLGLAAVIVFGR